MTEPTVDRTMEQIQRELIARRLRAIAGRLRDLGELVAQDADHLNEVPTRGRPTYATVVSQIQQNLIGGLANLFLPELTVDVQQADEYRIKGE
jgi:hypothetical protein